MKAAIRTMSVIAMIVVSGAHAQTTSDGSTTKDLLAACASDDQDTKTKLCDRTFGSFLYFAVEAETNMGYKSPNSPGLCFQLTEDAKGDVVRFEAAEVAWLKGHPELESKSEDDGLKAATLALYSCRKQ